MEQIKTIRYTNDCGDENLDPKQQAFNTNELQNKLAGFAKEFNEQGGVATIHTKENGRYHWSFTGITDDLHKRIIDHLDGFSVS